MQGICRYPGGKAKFGKLIVDRLSVPVESRQYREPFFGGGSIGINFLANNPHVKRAWINDKDAGMACLWTAVIRLPEQFKDRVMGFTPSVPAFFQFREELLAVAGMPDSDERLVDVAFKKIAIHQISYSGLGTKSGGPLGGVEQKSDYKIDCRWSPKYICGKIDKLHSQFSRVEFQGGGCTNLDFAEVIEGGDGTPALIYLDPPYYVKGNALYQHGFTEEDHRRLANCLDKCPHRWLLSYDDCQPVRDLYQWASVESLNVNYSITALKNKETGERTSRTKPELLITSNN